MNKCVVVSGGTKGIGKAIIENFALSVDWKFGKILKFDKSTKNTTHDNIIAEFITTLSKSISILFTL